MEESIPESGGRSPITRTSSFKDRMGGLGDTLNKRVKQVFYRIPDENFEI